VLPLLGATSGGAALSVMTFSDERSPNTTTTTTKTTTIIIIIVIITITVIITTTNNNNKNNNNDNNNDDDDDYNPTHAIKQGPSVVYDRVILVGCSSSSTSKLRQAMVADLDDGKVMQMVLLQ